MLGLATKAGNVPDAVGNPTTCPRSALGIKVWRAEPASHVALLVPEHLAVARGVWNRVLAIVVIPLKATVILL